MGDSGSSEKGPIRGVSVRLTGVSASASLADLYRHFTVVGTISSIHLQRDANGGPSTAHVTFTEESARETSLLLTDSAIKGSMVTVQAEPGYTPPSDAKFYLAFPTFVKPAVVVRVSNVSPSTTDQDLLDFFAFAGTVCCVHLPPMLDGAPRDSHVGFYEQAALENALLLSDAKVKGNILSIAKAPQYQPPPDSKFFPREGVKSTPAQQAQAMVRCMVEQGYTLGATAGLQARQFDERHRLSETASARAGELRQSAAAAVADLQKRLSEGREAISRSFQRRATDGAEEAREGLVERERREGAGVKSVEGQAQGSSQPQSQPASQPKSQEQSQPQSQAQSQAQSHGFLSVAQQRASEMGSYFSRSSAVYMAQSREYFASAAARMSSGVGQTSKVGSEPDSEPIRDSAVSGQGKGVQGVTGTLAGAGSVDSGRGEARGEERVVTAHKSGFVNADLSAAAATAAATPPRRIGTPLGGRGGMDESPLFYKDELPMSLAPSRRTPLRGVTVADSRSVTVTEGRGVTVMESRDGGASEFRDITLGESPGAPRDELPTSLGPSIRTQRRGVTVAGVGSPGRPKSVTVSAEGSPGGRLKGGGGSPGGLPMSTSPGDSMSRSLKGAVDARMVTASRAAARKAMQEVHRRKALSERSQRLACFLTK